MPESPYMILGAANAAPLGRRVLLNKLQGRLLKQSPDHVTVVGPRHYGKTFLLRHLAAVFENGQTGYVTSAYWDLKHNTPTCHEEFLGGLVGVLKASLREAGEGDLIEYLMESDGAIFDSLECLRDELARDSKRVLLVMDGFDHVLASDGITRQTWDAMRTLSQGKGLVMVTGSRRSLRELCRTEESATSDFWEVFNPSPLRVGCFQKEEDWPTIIEAFVSREITFDGSAVTEIFNWTGGIPTLVMLMLDRLYVNCRDGDVLTKSDIDRFGDAVKVECRDVIAPLWEDCSPSVKAVYRDITREGKICEEDLRSEHGRELLLRGLARNEGRFLRSSALMVKAYAEEQSSSLGTLRHLFGKPESFLENARKLVELRLEHVAVVNEDLHGMIRRAVRDLDEARFALTWARGITNEAFKIIWKEELPDGIIPDSWFRGDKAGEAIPKGGAEVNLLRRATGTDKEPRVTNSITKRTYALISFLHSVGDHGQHLSEGEDTETYAIAYCLAAVELAESLALDLGAPRLTFDS